MALKKAFKSVVVKDDFSHSKNLITQLDLINTCRYVFNLSPNTSYVDICLTLSHTIATFNDSKEEGFGKHIGKKRKYWFPAFSPFPTVFYSIKERNREFSNI